jgi:hypothetical protein
VRLPKQIVTEENERIRILQKALYCLKRASKVWYETFANWVLSSGFVQSESDPCIFYNQEFGVIMVLYVDDFLMASKEQNGVSTVFERLHSRFKSRMVGKPTFFLGMNVNYNQGRHEIIFTQQMIPRSLPMTPGAIFAKDLNDLITTTMTTTSNMMEYRESFDETKVQILPTRI